MSQAMSFTALKTLLIYVQQNHSPFNVRSGKRIIKYVDPHIDMRTAECFSITFRTYGGEFSFYTTNEFRDDPKSLFDRCIEWLNSDV